MNKWRGFSLAFGWMLFCAAIVVAPTLDIWPKSVPAFLTDAPIVVGGLGVGLALAMMFGCVVVTAMVSGQPTERGDGRSRRP